MRAAPLPPRGALIAEAPDAKAFGAFLFRACDGRHRETRAFRRSELARAGQRIRAANPEARAQAAAITVLILAVRRLPVLSVVDAESQRRMPEQPRGLRTPAISSAVMMVIGSIFS